MGFFLGVWGGLGGHYGVIMDSWGGLEGIWAVLEASWGWPPALAPAPGVLGGSFLDQIQLKCIQAKRHPGLDPGQLKAVD